MLIWYELHCICQLNSHMVSIYFCCFTRNTNAQCVCCLRSLNFFFYSGYSKICFYGIFWYPCMKNIVVPVRQVSVHHRCPLTSVLTTMSPPHHHMFNCTPSQCTSLYSLNDNTKIFFQTNHKGWDYDSTTHSYITDHYTICLYTLTHSRELLRALFISLCCSSFEWYCLALRQCCTEYNGPICVGYNLTRKIPHSVGVRFIYNTIDRNTRIHATFLITTDIHA
jgi:hypothetical protein